MNIINYLKELYPEDYVSVHRDIELLIEKYKKSGKVADRQLSEKDSILITYGDSLLREGEKPLITFKKFATKYFQDILSGIHFLPIYPYTSDDGFSVVDYRKVDEALGSWDDVESVKEEGFDLMLDAVVNHVSKSSHYVQEYLKGNEEFKDFFTEGDPNADYSNVTRPRVLPLLHPYQHIDGTRYLWTTFSEDQLDLNFKNPKVFLEVLDVLLGYAEHGARFIRLDAIGVIWKEDGTKCMHLEQAHKLIKIMRTVLDSCFEVKMITETNVPHEDNISYFGNGCDEASLVYQFPLPPLTMYSFLAKDATHLTEWAKMLDGSMKETAYFNFLSSHDGIGLRPVEGIFSEEQKQLLVDHTLSAGGRINYRTLPDGSKAPYEMNVNYLDAITLPNDCDDVRYKKFLAAQSILLSIAGVPGIYIHSMLGSRNDIEGMKSSNINRRINREKLNADKVITELQDENSLRHKIYNGLSCLLKIRREHKVFNPHCHQEVIDMGKEIFALKRNNDGEELLYIVNVTDCTVEIPIDNEGVDLVTNKKICTGNYFLRPYQFIWLKKIKGETL